VKRCRKSGYGFNLCNENNDLSDLLVFCTTKCTTNFLDEFLLECLKEVLMMSLEIFPDELLLLICSYLSAFDVRRAFNDLNVRLNCTIINYRRHMDLTRVKYDQFNQCCEMLLRSNFGLQVRSLNLSNKNPVVGQLALFAEQVWLLNEKLPNLERLTVFVFKNDELNLFLPDIVLLDN